MWHLRDGELVWENPEDENCHVEVCVRDRADGRFVPGLDVTMRHDHENGRRYLEPAEIEFDRVEIEPGQKFVE